VTASSAGQRRYDCCRLVHSEVVQSYLTAVFVLIGRGDVVGTSALAKRMGVSPPTVSVMLKRLTAAGLVTRPTIHVVELTEHGRRHALEIVRRHRLLETFLAEVVAVPWDEVHLEAELLEHAVSDRLLRRIDALLDQPTRDPHGDPIPPAEGSHEETWTPSLLGAEPGRPFRVERVSDQDSGALRHLAALGIRPGALLDLEGRDPFGGPVWVRVGENRQALGPALADLVHGRSL
jgi:DtxR family Mn-dependent transcriptional regulator